MQAKALWWILPLAFGVVWSIGGIYLFVQHSEPPKRRYNHSNTHKRKTKRRK